MLYHLELKAESWDEERQQWMVQTTNHNVAAVSRKHALNKALKLAPHILMAAKDRENDGWPTEWSAKLLEPT